MMEVFETNRRNISMLHAMAVLLLHISMGIMIVLLAMIAIGFVGFHVMQALGMQGLGLSQKIDFGTAQGLRQTEPYVYSVLGIGVIAGLLAFRPIATDMLYRGRYEIESGKLALRRKTGKKEISLDSITEIRMVSPQELGTVVKEVRYISPDFLRDRILDPTHRKRERDKRLEIFYGLSDMPDLRSLDPLFGSKNANQGKDFIVMTVKSENGPEMRVLNPKEPEKFFEALKARAEKK